MKFIIFTTLIMLFLGCSSFRPKKKLKIATEDLRINYVEVVDKPKPIALYKNKCIIPSDGIFYSTKDHDKLVNIMRKCSEATLGIPILDSKGNIKRDKDGRILRLKSHVDILLKKYEDSIKINNKTINDYNKIVDKYYDVETDKKSWRSTTLGSGGVIVILLMLIIII